MPAGAEQMTQILRTVARCTGNDSESEPKIFFTSDVKNAFGQVPRDRVLKAVIKHAPQLLPILLASWRPGNTTLFVPTGKGQAASFGVRDGLFQGECLATLLLCLVTHEAIQPVVRNGKSVPLYYRKALARNPMFQTSGSEPRWQPPPNPPWPPGPPGRGLPPPPME